MLKNRELEQTMRDFGMKLPGQRVKRTVVSVPHTGTRWARRTFECLSVHSYVDDEIVGVPIVPLRDPRAVWDSWCRRLGTGHAVPVNFDFAWEQLHELSHRYDFHYLPLDTPDRDECFYRICDALGEDLAPKWDQKDGHLELEVQDYPRDLSKIYELPFIKRFYGSLRV